MPKSILIIDGHPDPDPDRYCHALCAAYERGAKSAGHRVKQLPLSQCDFPILRTRAEWENGEAVDAIQRAQVDIANANHLVFVYPLWLGDMPALLKGFFEQAFRPGFAIAPEHISLLPGLLKRKSARVVVTMGMPAFVYRWFFFAHSLKSLERNILRFSGLHPVRHTLIGNIEGIQASARQNWLSVMEELGKAGR